MTEEGSDESASSAPSAYDAARASWGFPSFARDFPRTAELDALVVAFTYGDFKSVREGAPVARDRAESDEVRRAIDVLRARIEPDPQAKLLFALTALLLVFLTVFWVLESGPDASRTHGQASFLGEVLAT